MAGPQIATGNEQSNQKFVLKSAQDVTNLINSGTLKSGKSGAITLIALGGIFLDAYDFTSLSFGMNYIKDDFNLSPLMLSIVSASIMIGALLGSVFGGYFVDRIGRFKVFMADMVFFVVAAIACAVAPDEWWLLIARFLMGVGIGIDFPVAFSFLAEYASSKRKGGSVTLWQPIWYLAVSATFLILIPTYFLFNNFGWGENHMWRIVVGFGALPAIVIMIFRQKYMAESPSWAAQNLGLHEAAKILKKTYGVEVEVAADAVDPIAERKKNHMSIVDGWKIILNKKYLPRTLISLVINFGQALQYYAVGFFLGQIVLAILHSQDVMTNILSSLTVNLLFGLTGGILGTYLTGKIGPRKLSLFGFAGTTICMLIAGSMGSVNGWMAILGAMTVGLLIFCHAAGPGSQGMTMATLSYPTSIRGIGTGFSQIGIRLGALTGLIYWPLMTASFGLQALTFLAIMPFLAFVVILFIKWDPTGKNVDEEDYHTK